MASIRSKNGKWQARIKRGVILVEKSFTTKRDAERWARQTESAIERGDYKPPSSTEEWPATLQNLLDRYEKEVAGQHRSATSRINIGTLKRTLGTLPVPEISAREVARWRDERLQSVKPPSVGRELNTLSAVLNHARKEWCIPVINPVQDIKRPANGKPRTRRLQAGEEAKLLAELQPHYQRIVKLALETGMRRGEILALEWQHIDLSRSVALLPLTKNGEARMLPLSTEALRVLEVQRAEPVQPISGKVFDVHHISLDKAWRRACRRAGITDLHFHDLRHEAVSRLFERGLNPMEVAAISGHKTLEMLKRYTHLRAEELARKLV